MASLESSEFLIILATMKKNDFTLNDLALMVGRGFSSVDKRFDAVDKKLFNMDQRLMRIEREILEDHRNRIEILEMKIRGLEALRH